MAADPETTDIVASSRDVLATHARSFRWASVFLPADARDDAAVVYAFCRLADDLVDEAEDPAVGAADLAQLDAELLGTAPPRPLVAALHAVARRRGIDLASAHELNVGIGSDQGAVRVPDDAALLRYCYRVAGTVGLMMCGVIGVTHRGALAHAVDLGIGMQITNICRDVREDAGLGRVYLPATRLRAAGIDPERLAAGDIDRAKLAGVVRELLALAERYYASADDAMRHIPWRSRLAILVASRVYRAIGRRLLRNGADTWAGRTIVPWWEKGAWASLGLLAALHPRVAGWVQAPPHERVLHVGLEGLPGTDTD
jgi:phytoene synthase